MFNWEALDEFYFSEEALTEGETGSDVGDTLS